MRWLLLPLILISTGVFSQCKTYRLLSDGDTLNCVDMKNMKQGKWVIHVNELRGEPGFEEEGVLKDDQREGRWRRYSLSGDLLAIENYRWGNKDGIQQYFSMGSIEHEESWKAIDPQKKYDTIFVPDLYDPYKVDRKIFKVNTYSMKNGVWKYYMPGSQSLIKTETYIYDSLSVPKPEMAEKKKSSAVEILTGNDSIPALFVDPKQKPQHVIDFEKKNAKKKRVKLRDGKTGGY